jgi:hypothetical protein
VAGGASETCRALSTVQEVWIRVQLWVPGRKALCQAFQDQRADYHSEKASQHSNWDSQQVSPGFHREVDQRPHSCLYPILGSTALAQLTRSSFHTGSGHKERPDSGVSVANTGEKLTQQTVDIIRGHNLACLYSVLQAVAKGLH